MLLKLLKNDVLANLTFVLILVIGIISYLGLPRQQDPDINFNWIIVNTLLPGASAQDVEKLITDPLEDALKTLADVKFISSNSRESVSSLLLRFNQIDERTYDKHLSDLRREIQNIESDFPVAASTPKVFEIVSANAFPAATVLIKGIAYDENLRRQAKHVIDELKRMQGVDRVDNYGLNDPELQIYYQPEKLLEAGLNPTDLADSVKLLFNDLSAGSVTAAGQKWLVRLTGKSEDPADLGDFPILGKQGYIPLSSLARIERGQQEASRIVSSNGTPTVLAAVLKQSGANTLELIQRVQQYIEQRNQLTESTGVELVLVDDQSEITSNALNIMQTNALYGLSFVLLITFLFLGFRIALITTIGIPFILAGTFWVLSGLGHTLNVSVLLAVVIALGMLVDDAVVVAESIYHRIVLGEARDSAVLSALKEVFAPVTTAVLTTMAAFLPLVLLPGILGEFMRVIPLVVTVALTISLVEAYWMLPAHVLVMNFDIHQKPSRTQQWRMRMTRNIRIFYTRQLIKVLRIPRTMLALSLLLFVAAVAIMASPMIKKDFFASDTLRLFYISIEMPPASVLENTHRKVEQVEKMARRLLGKQEFREMVSYSGLLFTETEPRFGNHYGQVLIGLNPLQPGMRSVEQIMQDMRAEVTALPGAENISFLKLSGGPPTAKAISVKVRGEDYDEIARASAELKAVLEAHPDVSDITDDADRGSNQVSYRLRHAMIQQLGINPAQLSRTLLLSVDGEILSSVQINGDKTEVRLLSADDNLQQIGALLQQIVFTPTGQGLPLSELLSAETRTSLGNIRHYNFKRTITIEADIDKTRIDELAANNFIRQEWDKIKTRYPNIDLDFSGILDDINEALDSIVVLFIFGVGLMYLILGTQFKSYFQPLMILSTVLMAFTGVVLGILITQQALSLYALYGIVALAGIAVNSAIVLISTANAKLASGMSLLHSTVYSARRRVIPIIITTLTTIGGLLSLAMGLGGDSLIWKPVANAIVWGLGFSATLTLFIIPILYRLFMRRSRMQG
ncbi:MAG: efflux RND transporter permease subunit [Gammaproteobacteria bacterium]|nr:efflux RND transporter permease subunit [Gammaproteobacteria bacterium]